jgi:hypothetical protein
VEDSSCVSHRRSRSLDRENHIKPRYRTVVRVIGTVVKVIPNDRGTANFNLYDVAFSSGLLTLHGVDLTPIATNNSSCETKDQLFTAYKKAVNVYSQLVSELVEAVGMAAHSEFEFITRKVEIARNITNGAQERLHKHKAEHGC